ncbi:MAG: hypothetical protein M1815_003913 [Lichina confinis]|nr:MAG: hypothetical protein M1815_003913 [Lichina confinis]
MHDARPCHTHEREASEQASYSTASYRHSIAPLLSGTSREAYGYYPKQRAAGGGGWRLQQSLSQPVQLLASRAQTCCSNNSSSSNSGLQHGRQIDLQRFIAANRCREKQTNTNTGLGQGGVTEPEAEDPVLGNPQAGGSTPFEVDCNRDDQAPGLGVVVHPDA